MGANAEDVTVQGKINENGDCECEVTTEYCNDCADLRENSSDFYVNGVTERVCESLESNQGFDPENDDDNCSALHKADDCLINTLIDKLPAYDVCDWNEFMSEYLPNQYNINEALICWLCGVEKRFFAQQLDVELRWQQKQARPGERLTVDKQGNWTYSWTDWIVDGVTPYGSGTITGKVNFCMKQLEKNKAQYQISSVEVKKFKWTPSGQSTATIVTHTWKVPDSNGAQVVKHSLSKAIDNNVNKRIALDKKGTIEADGYSPWINVAWAYEDWVLDSEHQLQIRFKNGNTNNTVPMCE